jgi:hypothetical protein
MMLFLTGRYINFKEQSTSWLRRPEQDTSVQSGTTHQMITITHGFDTEDYKRNQTAIAHLSTSRIQKCHSCSLQKHLCSILVDALWVCGDPAYHCML